MSEEFLTKDDRKVDSTKGFNKKVNKNIAITGKRQVGKTTLLKQLISKTKVEVAGYQTVPYQLEGEFSGYDMVNVTTGEKKAISRKQSDESFCPLVETFEQFGTKLLGEAMQSDAPIIMLDEIGRFERKAQRFISNIHEVLDSEKFVLAVLKKEPIDFIEKIKEREDIILIDLDRMPWEEAYQMVEDYVRVFLPE